MNTGRIFKFDKTHSGSSAKMDHGISEKFIHAKTHEFVSSCMKWILLACPELYCDWSLHYQRSWNFSGIHGFPSLTLRFLRKNQPCFQREMVTLVRHLSDVYKAPLPKSPRIHSQRQEVYSVKWHITKQPIEGSKLPPPPTPPSPLIGMDLARPSWLKLF